MSRLSREKKREQKRAERSAPAASFDVLVPVDGPGAGGASIGGVPVGVAPGEEIQQAVLNHLHRIAVATGHPVQALIHDERIGYVVPLQVSPDGSSHFTSEPYPTAAPNPVSFPDLQASLPPGAPTRSAAPAPAEGPAAPPAPEHGPASGGRIPASSGASGSAASVPSGVSGSAASVPSGVSGSVPSASSAASGLPGAPQPPAPPAPLGPPAVPTPPEAPAATPAAVAPEPQRAPRDSATHVMRAVEEAKPGGESAPTFPLRAVPEPTGGTPQTFPLRAVPEPTGDTPPTFPLRAVPESSQGTSLGAVTPPTGQFGPPPLMDARPTSTDAAGDTHGLDPAHAPQPAHTPDRAPGPPQPARPAHAPDGALDLAHAPRPSHTPDRALPPAPGTGPAPAFAPELGPTPRPAPAPNPAAAPRPSHTSDRALPPAPGTSPAPAFAPELGPAPGIGPVPASELGPTPRPAHAPARGFTPGLAPGLTPAPARERALPLTSAFPLDPALPPEPDPKPTPARGFDAVAEAVLGDGPVVAAEGGAASAPLVEPIGRINEAVKAGRIEAAAELAERTVEEASRTLGPEHAEVLRLRELAAYIAYLAGDPLRAFQLSLDLTRIRRRAGDAEAAYGNIQSAAAAWRAVRDPEQGLRMGRDLIELWTELTVEDGPAIDDIEQLESARARMGRLTERARKSAAPPMS
jgi:hypothetical protein